MALTINEAHLSLAYRLGESSVPASSTELAKRLDWFKRAISIVLAGEEYFWFMETFTTDSTEADVQDYTVPTRWRKFTQIKVDDYQYEEVPFDEIYSRYEMPMSPVPILPSFMARAFYVRNNTLMLIPIPDAAPTAYSVTSITRSSTTATVTMAAAHGWYNDDYVTIAGAVETDYNVRAQITVTGETTFTYTVANSPTTPATGTITATKDNIKMWYYEYPSLPTSTSSSIVLPDEFMDILISYAEGRYWSSAHKRAKAADAFTEFESLVDKLKKENFRKKFNSAGGIRTPYYYR